MSDKAAHSTINIKTGLAEMLKGGVIMDVVTAEQAKVAEQAGAVAVMALERVPSDIRKAGGVARMSPPNIIEEVQEAVSIILRKRNCWKRWALITLTRVKC
jgi:pyridoxal 5'-phosphate synthase pdxS subunit